MAGVGVERTGSYGSGLTRHLQAHQISVLEVNRPDRRIRMVRGESDAIDAENEARRALSSHDTATPKDTISAVEAVRALTVARSGAVKARAAALNQFKELVTAAPEPLRTSFTGEPLRQVAEASARRHRINRAGDRRANRTLHMITVLRMRWHPAIRTYVQRRTAEGLSKPEIMRCLKRYIAREAYPHTTPSWQTYP